MKTTLGIFDGKVVQLLSPLYLPPDSRVLTVYNEESSRSGVIAPPALEQVAGCLLYKAKPKSLEEMSDAIRLGAITKSK